MDPADAEQIVAVERAAASLAAVPGNAAFMLHEDGRPAEEVVEYLQEFDLRSRGEAQKTVEFLSDPLWRSYIFTYFYGERLLRAWLERTGWETGFRRLLTEALYPSELAGGRSVA